MSFAPLYLQLQIVADSNLVLCFSYLIGQIGFMSSAQEGMEESHAQSDSWQPQTASWDVPVDDIGYCGTAGASFGERRQWFEDHPDLRSWLPSGIDDATWEQLQAFTGWFDIDKRNSSEVIWHTGHERPSMLWLWLNTEHLTKESVFKVLCEGAQVFYQKVAWCSVYHPEWYMKRTKNVDMAMSFTLGELSRPIAFAKIIRVMCEEVENGATESGPAEVPPDGDLLVEFSSEDDQDDSRAHDT
jgi:hypothetical protein